MKTQHPNNQLSYMRWDFFLNCKKKYISMKGGLKLSKLSFILSFIFLERLHSPNSTTTINNLNVVH
jgi:hypothetical protein